MFILATFGIFSTHSHPFFENRGSPFDHFSPNSRALRGFQFGMRFRALSKVCFDDSCQIQENVRYSVLIQRL